MNFAEELQQKIDTNYIEWKKKYDNALKESTKYDIDKYGYASALCDYHIDTTTFQKDWATCKKSDEKYLSKWIKENGFHEGSEYNSYGVKSVTWRI